MGLSTTYTKAETDFLIQQVGNLNGKSEIVYENLKPVNSQAVEKYAVKKINTIADLRNTVGEYEGQIVELLGYYQVGDAPVIKYKWLNINVPDDGGKYINIEEEGTWEAQFNSVVDLRNYGVFPNVSELDDINPTSDITTQFQKALDYGGRLFLPIGRYFIGNSEGLRITKNNTQLEGVMGNSILVAGNAVKTGENRYYKTLSIYNEDTFNVENVVIKNIRFERRADLWRDEFDQFYHHINIMGASMLTIENCSIYGTLGDGICLGGSIAHLNTETYKAKVFNKNIYLYNNIIDGRNNENRNGISVIDGENVWICGNSISNFTRPNMPGAIDIEPNNDDNYIIKNIYIENNTFYNIGGNAGVIGVYGSIAPKVVEPNNIQIKNNTLKGGGSNKNSYVFYCDLSAASKSSSLNSPKNNILIERNVIDGKIATDIMLSYGVKGLTFKGNKIDEFDKGIFLGWYNDILKAKRMNFDVEIFGNEFKNSTSSPCIRLTYVDGCKIYGNTFKDSSLSVIIDISSGTDIKNISIFGNSFENINHNANYYLHYVTNSINIVDFSTFYLGENDIKGNLIEILKKNEKSSSIVRKSTESNYSNSSDFGDFRIFSPASISEGQRANNSRFGVNMYSASTSGNTLWKDVQLVKYMNTVDRPTMSFNGEMIFDANLGRPLWYYNSQWRDLLAPSTTSNIGMVKQSPSVTDVSTTPPTQLGAQTVTTIEQAQTAINNLVAMVNAMQTNEVELKTKLNAKLTADRNSGQQAT